jgi:hypothetical protein
VASGIFSGASSGGVAVTPAVTMTILGEEWTGIAASAPTWGAATAGGAAVWATPPAGATGNWLGQ